MKIMFFSFMIFFVSSGFCSEDFRIFPEINSREKKSGKSWKIPVKTITMNGNCE